MDKKLLVTVLAIIIIAGGGLYFSKQNKDQAYIDPLDEPAYLPSEFVITPTGGGKFKIGEEVKAGFTMKYTGKLENENSENSTFSVHEASILATSNSDALVPTEKREVSIMEIAKLDETISYEITGYTCAKADYATLVVQNILIDYKIDGVIQKSEIGDVDQYWGEVIIPIECVEGGEMIQIKPPTLSIPAGSAPLGTNEAETGFLHEDGNRYYNGQRVDQEDSIVDDLR